MNQNLLELWGQTLLGMAKITQGPQGFFDLFQNGFAKKEHKPDSMQEEFIELCRKTFGKEGIEKFNEIMKEFYENAGVVPLTQYNELHEKYVDLKDKVRELEKKIEMPDSGSSKTLDLGFVGEPEEVNTRIVDIITDSDLIPVIAPVCVSREGQTYNVNADTFAGALAGALQAKRLLLLTDVAGVLDKGGKLIDRLTVSEAHALIQDETISGGMIPKIESCTSVVESGVEAVVILDGRVKHALLLELFTDHGAGTMFTG